MADRRHLSRFAAHNVEDADAILTRGDPVERADPEIVGETLDASLEHARPPAGRGRLLTRPQSEMRRDLGATAGLHPFIDALSVVDDFRDGAVETEETVGEIER